jgi:hypothetical protein
LTFTTVIPARRNAEKRDRILQKVGQHDGHAIALRGTGESLQKRSKIARQAIHFAEAQCLAEVAEGRLVGELANRVIDQFG